MTQYFVHIPSRFWPFLFWAYKGCRHWAALFITAAATSGFYFVVNTNALQRIIDRLPDAYASNSWAHLALPFIVLICSHQAHLLLWRSMLWINSRAAPEVKSRIIRHMFSYALNHSHAFYQNNLTGSIASKINTLALCLESLCYIPTAFCTRALFQILSAATVLATIKPLFAFSLLFWSGIFVGISVLFYKKSRNYSQAYAHEIATITGRVVDNITNISSVRLFAQASTEITKLSSLFERMRRAFRARDKITLVAYTIQGLSATSLIGCSLFFLIQAYLNKEISLGEFIFVQAAALSIGENLWMVIHQIHTAQDLVGQCSSTLDAILQPHTVSSPQNPESFQAKGAITFNDVHFTYPQQTQPLFQGISLTIPTGQKVGLVGSSGSGKSTFISLILRLFDVEKGAISLDNRDLRSLHLHDLHTSISLAPQSPLLFHRSLRENICYGKQDATEQAMIAAARTAHAHDFITQTADGYDSVVGEQGLKLSGGQRQRVALARALLKDAPILILDEATSQIDTIVEQAIQESVDASAEQKTVIIAAHRLSTLKNVDRILVFENGTITGDGTHNHLLKTNSHYAYLWKNYRN